MCHNNDVITVEQAIENVPTSDSLLRGEIGVALVHEVYERRVL